MKKMFKIGLIIVAISITLYNTVLADYLDEGGCVFKKGDNISGTHCWVTNVHGEGTNRQFYFDTFWCTSTCPLDGTHCCYDLEVRGDD